MPELNVQVNENDEVIGLRPREDFYNDNSLIHRSSHLLLFNSQKELLLQQRSFSKKWYPGLITFSVSGTVGDESYEECLAREMKEEIGISIPFKELFIFRHADESTNAFKCVFIAQSDKKVKVDKREAESFIWTSPEDLKEDVANYPEKYTLPFIKGIKIFFDQYADDIVK